MLVLTHRELEAAGARWLRTRGYTLIEIEPVSSATGEVPDVIGWKRNMSILLEAKTSRADFARDREKECRHPAGAGLGQLRYYITSAGLILPEEVQNGWGLLAVYPKMTREIKTPPKLIEFSGRTSTKEVILLVSLVLKYRTERDDLRAAGLTAPKRSIFPPPTFVRNGPHPRDRP